MTTFTLPALFWRDHFERCAAHPGTREIIRDGRLTVRVDLDAEALADLKSDAELYASPYGPDVDDGGALRRSAARTLKAIGPPVAAEGKR